MPATSCVSAARASSQGSDGTFRHHGRPLAFSSFPAEHAMGRKDSAVTATFLVAVADNPLERVSLAGKDRAPARTTGFAFYGLYFSPYFRPGCGVVSLARPDVPTVLSEWRLRNYPPAPLVHWAGLGWASESASPSRPASGLLGEQRRRVRGFN